MPQPGMLWRYLTLHAHGTWLHGDPRGFRSRQHRIHSSGDYNDPPPPGEHEGLHRYHLQRSKGPTLFPPELFAKIGQAIVRELLDEGLRVLVVSVGTTHAHAVVELANDLREVRRVVGRCKNVASRAVRTELPGTIWAAGEGKKPIFTEQHLHAAFDYVAHDQEPGTWVWTFRDPPPPPKKKRRTKPGRSTEAQRPCGAPDAIS